MQSQRVNIHTKQKRIALRAPDARRGELLDRAQALLFRLDTPPRKLAAQIAPPEDYKRTYRQIEKIRDGEGPTNLNFIIRLITFSLVHGDSQTALLNYKDMPPLALLDDITTLTLCWLRGHVRDAARANGWRGARPSSGSPLTRDLLRNWKIGEEEIPVEERPSPQLATIWEVVWFLDLDFADLGNYLFQTFAEAQGVFKAPPEFFRELAEELGRFFA